MNKVGRVSFIAVALIVVLRIAIGWQLFYEGVWKIKTLKSPTPWTAAGYLKNSQGPLRGMFRNMAGDPDDLDWLDADKVTAKWDAWQKRFGSHYKLSAPQISRLNRLLNGSSEYAVKLPAGVLPNGVDITSQKVRLSSKDVVPVLSFNAEKGTLVARGDSRLTPIEKKKLIDAAKPLSDQYAPFVDAVEKLREITNAEANERPAEISVEFADDAMPAEFDLAAILTSVTVETPMEDGGSELAPLVSYDDSASVLMVRGDVEATPDLFDQLIASINYPGYIAAVEKLYTAASRLGYKQQVIAQLKGNPENTGVKAQGKIGEIEKYKNKLADYESHLAAAKQDYDYEHLDYTWKEIQSLRASLVGPIKALDADLKKAAQELLTLEQLELGAAPKPWTSLRISDTLTIVGLACLGLMLICGLFTRFAAASAAFMLFSFYMAMPPLPGLPELPGPEHSLIVNKNLIEVFALAAIAALPTGMWFGLDSFIAWFFAGSKEN